MAVDRDRVLQAAQKLVERKRYDKAIVEYQRLVDDDPKDIRTLLRIGDLYLKMEEHVDAITTYERVGQFYAQQGEAKKASAVYKQIREIIHKHVPGMEERFGHIVPTLAELYTKVGLKNEALAAYDEVATKLQRTGRDKEAIEIFRRVVDLDPQNPLPYLRLAEANLKIKDVDNAIQRFGAAAEILLKQGRREDALKVVERLLQHRSDPKFARIAAEIYLERGQPNDGMAALTKLQISFKDNPKDLETLALLARAFDKLGQPSKAIEVQKESARIAKDAGKIDQFNALVEALVSRAPNDEVVRALVQQRAAMAQTAAEARLSIDIEVDEEVELDADDVESVNSGPASSGPVSAPASSQAPIQLIHPNYGNVQIPPPTASRPVASDPAARARQIVIQADVHRRAKEYDAAIGTLVEGIEELPSARNLREKLCDTLIEAGDQPEAVRQMLAFARWLANENDVEAAARLLDEVLLLEPNQPDALEMLRLLGYAVGTDAYGQEHAGSVYPDQAAVDPSAQYPVGTMGLRGPDPNPAYPYAQPAYDPNAPLPHWDIDDDIGAPPMTAGSPAGAAPSTATYPAGYGAGNAFLPNQVDEPFGEAPLPRFNFEEEATQFMQIPPPRASMQGVAPGAPPPRESTAYARQPSTLPGARERSPTMPPAQFDEESLEEVEFFASHGMFDEARALLDEQLARLPNHPLLLERKREIEAMAAGHVEGSGTRMMPFGTMVEGRYDIDNSLDALDRLDEVPEQPMVAPDTDDQVSVESVFEQFKQGVAAQISPSDAATHYDLGVAYKEMGLHSDAIAEFELASRDPQRECVCNSMIGTIYLQLGSVESAIDAFIRGLHSSIKTREQELALTYEIGQCYESRSARDQALYYFQRVARIDPGYNDPRGSVAERIRRLEPPPVVKPVVTKVAVGADVAPDEFDAALDDLLDRTDLP